MNRKSFRWLCLAFIALFVLTAGSSYASMEYPVKSPVINSQEDADKLLEFSKKVLKDKLGMRFRLPVKVKLVSAAEIDRLTAKSPYKGRVVGIHTMQGRTHVILMLNDRGIDDFFGVLCHETTHGWQAENCPYQSVTLKEGLAVWVQIKCLQWVGAYSMANSIRRWTADPIYGVGFRFVQKLEEKYGEEGVLREVVKLKDVSIKEVVMVMNRLSTTGLW